MNATIAIVSADEQRAVALEMRVLPVVHELDGAGREQVVDDRERAADEHDEHSRCGNQDQHLVARPRLPPPPHFVQFGLASAMTSRTRATSWIVAGALPKPFSRVPAQVSLASTAMER